jgi:uncharacterized protein YjbI with pentapeptide repeats
MSAILILALLTTWLTQIGCDEGVTREALAAFGGAHKNSGRRMDVIAEFGKDYSGLNLRGVDFRGAHAIGLETNLAGADFTNADLSGAQFGGAILDGADFAGANLTDAEFVTASLRKANFRGAKLLGVRFRQCLLTGASLADLDLSQTTFNSSNLEGADLSRSVLAGHAESLWGVNLASAELTGADLHGLKLSGNSFRDAVLRSANLEGTDLVEADFSSADLTGAQLANAKVIAADFRSARGLSDTHHEQLLSRPGRREFELKRGIRGFLDSLAFPIVLLLVVPVIAFGPRLLNTRAAIRQRPDEWRPSGQFSLATLFVVVLGLSGLLGVATWSMTGAYSYSMVCALYMLVAEAVFRPPQRKKAAVLLALAIGYPAVNFALFASMPFLIFNPVFMIGVTVVAPLCALGIAVFSVLPGRASFPWIGMIGFVVWMFDVALANMWVISAAAASV